MHWKAREREREKGIILMVEFITYSPVPDCEGYNMRIYCFNPEFISCSPNGNDPTPNKILLSRSIYGWDDVRLDWRPPS